MNFIHSFLLGNLAILICMHQKQQLSDILIRLRNLVRLFWEGCHLRNGHNGNCEHSGYQRNNESLGRHG